MESRSTDRETLVGRTLHAATQDMRPETFARFDLHCVFNKLDYLALKRIAELHVRQALEMINSQGHHVTYATDVVEYVQREGYSEHFGARPMQNAAMRILGGLVAEQMLSDEGRRVKGSLCYNRRTNECFLEAETHG